MGILDLYLNPIKLEPPKPPKLNKKNRRKLCSHEYIYEKWVHNGPVQGTSFHYKRFCPKCGVRKCVPRTKEVYELVRNAPWKSKRKRKFKIML